MTVEELIEALKKYPSDMEVLVQYRDDGGYYSGEDDYIYLSERDGKLIL